MTKKKKPSFEDKCLKVTDFLCNHLEPFTEKELIKLLPKNVSGVHFREVKKILEVLTTEGEMCSEKVGLLRLYWATPSTQKLSLTAAEGQITYLNIKKQPVRNDPNSIQTRLQEEKSFQEVLQGKLEQCQKKLGVLQTTKLEFVSKASDDEEDSTHTEAQAKYDETLKYLIQTLKPELQKLQKEYATLKREDPDFPQKIQPTIKFFHECIDRWTDNMSILAQHMKTRFGLSYERFCGFFDIPKDFDQSLGDE